MRPARYTMKRHAAKRRRARTIMDSVPHMAPTVSSQRRVLENTMRDVNARRVYRRGEGETFETRATLDSVTDHRLFHDDEDRLARYLLNNCIEDIRAMCAGSGDTTDDDACMHERIVPDERQGCESCIDCGETFVLPVSDTAWMDGFRTGTHTLVRRHLYDRKAYFRNNLRGLFSQTNARRAPDTVLSWARSREPTDGRDLLAKMKTAPKRERDALRLPRYYKLAHAIYQDVARLEETPPSLFADTEDKILHMYDGCLHAFASMRTEFKRRSFLNKFYVMRQLLRMADMDECVLSMVPTMRMKSKVREHDVMWRRICDHLKWPFEPLCE